MSGAEGHPNGIDKPVLDILLVLEGGEDVKANAAVLSHTPGQILLIHHDFRLAATISTPETCGKAPTR